MPIATPVRLRSGSESRWPRVREGARLFAGRRADFVASLLVAAAAAEASFAKPKSRIFAWPLRGDENICGFDVAMDDAVAMSGLQSSGDLQAQIHDLCERHSGAGSSLLAAINSRNVWPSRSCITRNGPPLVLPEFVNWTDVGMFQRRGRARFAFKAFERRRIFAGFFGEKLKRNAAAEFRVLRAVDQAHASAA